VARVSVQDTGRDPERDAARGRRGNRSWYWLLVLPLLGTLIPPIYDSADPKLIGIPFFYWYQMLWILISVACTTAVYRKTRGER
jgi:hypothetical protein